MSLQRCQARDIVKLGTRVKQTDGSIKAPAVFSRTGNQSYTRRELGLDGDPNEVIVLNRPASEVSAPESIASLDGKTMTLRHPPVDITPENWRQYSVGDAHGLAYAAASASSGTVSGEAHVRDLAALKALDAGNDELSVGYSFDLDLTPGKDAETGEPYHGVQRNIRGNHHAIVDSGRCGGRCRVGDASHKETPMSVRNIKIEDRKFVRIVDHATVETDLPGFEIDLDVSTPTGAKAADAIDRFARGMKDCMAAHDSVKAEIGIHKERADAAEKRLAQLDAMPDSDEEDEEPDEGADKSAKAGDRSIAYVNRLVGKAKDAKKTVADAQAKSKDEHIELLVVERATVVADARKLVGDSFSDKGKSIVAIRAEAVGHAFANDAAIKPLIEANLRGVALDKATVEKMADIFAVAVAAKKASPASTQDSNADVFRILAFDRSTSAGSGTGGSTSVVDMSDPQAALKGRQMNGGRIDGKEAGV